MYDTKYDFLSPGVFGAIREIEYVNKIRTIFDQRLESKTFFILSNFLGLASVANIMMSQESHKNIGSVLLSQFLGDTEEAKELRINPANQPKYYYMGFYIQDCQKSVYKGRFSSPSLEIFQ